MRNARKLVVGLAVVLGSLAAVGSAAAQDKIIKIDGSSTVFPATEAVAEEFQTSMKGAVKVTVGISGTGGGFKKFCRGETDISNASRPIMAEEMKLAKENGIEYIELPICFDALTVAVHAKNTFVDHLTVAELKKIWEPEAQGKVMTWDQVRTGWPKEKIDLYGAGSDSGTFDYFTEAICGKAKASRGDFTGSEDDNVLVRGIEGSPFSLGYLPFSYYAAHSSKMKAVPIMWEGHTAKPVLPSMENVSQGKYNPLARPLFIYVNKKAAQEKPWVRDFVMYYLNHGPELVQEVKYLALPSQAYEMCKERFTQMKAGTGFAGTPEVGLPVEEILRRPVTSDVKAAPAKEEKK